MSHDINETKSYPLRMDELDLKLKDNSNAMVGDMSALDEKIDLTIDGINSLKADQLNLEKDFLLMKQQ